MNAVARPELTIEALEAGSIEAGCFDHEAHIYVAWLYLQRYPPTDAIARFTAALRSLTIKLGVPGKYHETISWFFLILIAERRASASTDNWSEFRRDNDDLFCRDENILCRYYSDALIGSDKARRIFVLPDKPCRGDT